MLNAVQISLTQGEDPEDLETTIETANIQPTTVLQRRLKIQNREFRRTCIELYEVGHRRKGDFIPRLVVANVHVS